MTNPSYTNSQGDGNAHPSDPQVLPPDILDAKLAKLRTELVQEIAASVQQASENALEKYIGLKPLLSINDVADTLGVSKRTCETLLAAKELPPPLYIGSQRRWHPDTISAYVRSEAGARGR